MKLHLAPLLLPWMVLVTSKGPINGKAEELMARWVRTGPIWERDLLSYRPHLCASFLCNGVLTYIAHQVGTAIYKPRAGQQR